jgi:hypothetical protein
MQKKLTSLAAAFLRAAAICVSSAMAADAKADRSTERAVTEFQQAMKSRGAEVASHGRRETDLR